MSLIRHNPAMLRKPLESMEAMELIADEFVVARSRFPQFNSPHEGWAVIKEEIDELWTEVKDNKRLPEEYKPAMRFEAVQVAAMALAFMLECT